VWCVVRGHRWAVANDVHVAEVLLRCGRCGHELIHSAETFAPEIFGSDAVLEEAARQRLTDAYVDMGTNPPRRG
jgi:hypothetical protein